MDNTLIRCTLPARPRARVGTPPVAATPRAAGRLARVCLLGVLVLAGCAGSRQYLIEVDGAVPAPLVDPLPYTVGVYYSPEFSDYTSEQESISGDSWRVAFDDLQRRYVHKMLVSAFDEVVIADEATPGPAAAYQFLVIPKIDNFSFLTPSESGSKFFAVSMRHYLEFVGRDGTSYGAWEINSYGRSRSHFGRSVKEMAMEACLDAMRDLAASLVVGLPGELVNRGVVNTDTRAGLSSPRP